jgi:uncharacterized protein
MFQRLALWKTPKKSILSHDPRLRVEESLDQATPPSPRLARVTLGVSNMAISKELLEILVCPVCKATVELKPDQSGLKCVECHRVYPVRDEIPVMLVDEAKIEE